MDDPRPPISELRRRYEQERHFQDDRAAAEYAYALAVRLREAGQRDEAQTVARECLRPAETLPSSTLDDVAMTHTTIGGVPMPERFHDGVVRARLADLLVPATELPRPSTESMRVAPPPWSTRGTVQAGARQPNACAGTVELAISKLRQGGLQR